MSKTFVMIHGSWHGGWAWQEVVRHLSQKGHIAKAPTLPGHGPRAMRLGLAHDDCVRAVVAYIQQHRLENVVLVGHSFGGSVIQKVAEELPNRIERTIFLDALIVEDGNCVFDELPADYVTLFNELASTSSDNTMLIPWEIWRDNFIQDASESVARSFWEQLSPSPIRSIWTSYVWNGFIPSPFPGALSTAAMIRRCRKDIFILECRRASEYSN